MSAPSDRLDELELRAIVERAISGGLVDDVVGYWASSGYYSRAARFFADALVAKLRASLGLPVPKLEWTFDKRGWLYEAVVERWRALGCVRPADFEERCRENGLAPMDEVP